MRIAAYSAYFLNELQGPEWCLELGRHTIVDEGADQVYAINEG